MGVVVVMEVGEGGGVGSLSFDVQEQGGGVLPNSDPFRQTEKGGGRRVQKLDIFSWMS